MINKGFVSSVEFPDPAKSWAEGLVAVGGILDGGTLYHAYHRGIFPWPQEGVPMLWFCPEERGVLFFHELHVPRRLKSSMKDDGLRYTRNEAFAEVIHACREQKRPGQTGTWITPEVEAAYIQFHRTGYARSYEVWRGNKLVGGMYGVLLEGVFSGESMFHTETDASKKAVLYAVEDLKSEGHEWMDTQMVTPVIASFGGRLIPKREYLRMLKARQKQWQNSEKS